MEANIEKGSSCHNEGSIDSAGSPPKKPSTLKNHLRRFWWMHLIIFLLLSLILTIILLFAVFPKIAQDGVDKSRIEIVALEVLDPTVDTVHIKQDYIVFANNHVYHPHLDSFNASVGLEGDEPYGMLTLPAVDSGDNVPGNLSQTLVITNQTAFERYNRALMQNSMITQFIRGETNLHEMSFPVHSVTYNKKVLLNGFNKLAGFNVTSFTLLGKAFSNGTNSLGNVTIPNASDITVAMGNVTFNNYVGEVCIGNTTLVNTVLAPGTNFLTMYSTVNQTAVLPLISKYTGGKLPVTIVANSSVYDGVHLTYYEYALQGGNLSTVIDATAALANINPLR